MPHPQVNAVLFDMDGLMLDSENVYTHVSNEVLKPYGKVMTWEVKSQLMGRPAHDSAATLIKAMDLPLTPDELLAKMDVKLAEAFTKVQPLPGVVKLVHHLAKHKIPMAIATGSKQKNYAIKTAHLDYLFGPFGTNVLCGDDSILEGKGKPDPTIFLEAAKMLGITDDESRKKVLVFEDGAPGVRAARAAGMEVVWVPDPELVKVMSGSDDLDPTHTHSTLEDFVPEEWGLPPYSD
ncbi:Haloacid dehalogenase-like hydrolase domain containing protein [Pseudohyphozyma bogoriensis]|nr:Haloacid dehalogenase-like hydrolase domain containing protein [Pseudohyphozyma bogoriensis]